MDWGKHYVFEGSVEGGKGSVFKWRNSSGILDFLEALHAFGLVLFIQPIQHVLHALVSQFSVLIPVKLLREVAIDFFCHGPFVTVLADTENEDANKQCGRYEKQIDRPFHDSFCLEDGRGLFPDQGVSKAACSWRYVWMRSEMPSEISSKRPPIALTADP